MRKIATPLGSGRLRGRGSRRRFSRRRLRSWANMEWLSPHPVGSVSMFARVLGSTEQPACAGGRGQLPVIRTRS